jgi:uncharacterized phage protein gp47/JayE
MPDQLDNTGLHVKSLTDIIADITTALQTAYGSDINLSQNSPDAQLMNIYAQAASDLRQLLVAVYNSFSPLSASGTTLDERVAINGITRLAGTYTLQNVNITVSGALTLYGLDQSAQPVFTVADNAGNQFQLVATQTPGGPGTNTYQFRAVAVGAVQTLPNTITNQVTIVLGVTAVNNPAAATSTGVDEESDAALKIRQARSFFLAATGPVDAIIAALLQVTGVTNATVIENATAGTVGGVPAHGIWAIVENGSNADVAQAIYSKKAPGTPMVGGTSVVVSRPSGGTETILFDRPLYTNLYIRFTILPRNAGETFDTALIKQQLSAAIAYKINQQASIGDPINAMFTIAPDAILTSVGVGTDGVNYFDTATPATPQYRFLVDPTRIIIS